MNQKSKEEMLLSFGKACLDWEFVKDKVQVQIRPKSEEQVIKRDFLDLEAIIGVYNDECEAWIEYKSSVLNVLNISEDELFETARNNMLQNCCFAVVRGEYILIAATNNAMHKGAGMMYSTDVLDQLCSMFNTSKLFVLPSSVHEILAVPYRNDPEIIDFINESIQEINDTELDPMDILSEHVYIYDSDLKKLYF